MRARGAHTGQPVLGQTFRLTDSRLTCKQKLKVLWAILIVALVANFSLPALEPVVSRRYQDDATPVSEQKDVKTLEEEEKDASNKAKAAELRLKDEQKPFVPSPNLVEAMANATRAEENYEELAQDEQQVNDTVTEDTKEFNVISRAFHKALLKDLLL